MKNILNCLLAALPFAQVSVAQGQSTNLLKLLSELDAPKESERNLIKCADFSGRWQANCSLELSGESMVKEFEIAQKNCEFLVISGFPFGMGGGMTLSTVSNDKSLHVDAILDWREDGQAIKINERFNARALGRDAYLAGRSESNMVLENNKIQASGSYRIEISKNGLIERTLADNTVCNMVKVEKE